MYTVQGLPHVHVISRLQSSFSIATFPFPLRHDELRWECDKDRRAVYATCVMKVLKLCKLQERNAEKGKGMRSSEDRGAQQPGKLSSNCCYFNRVKG